MLNKIKEIIDKYNLIEEKDKILIGVSGGPDSISLLHALYTLKYNVVVAHINHGLRENAIIDEEYVKSFCEKKKIPIHIKHINLKDISNKMTIEEAGRKERYEFFYEVMRKEGCTKIATAHNSNDNAETVIMNMIRGSGLHGLKGIEPIRDEIIIRPLIEITRNQIERYCEENNLNPRHDESNDDTLYTRNKIRLELIPYIEKNINSNVISNINRMSEIISCEEQYISKQIEKSYNECVVKEEIGKNIYNLKLFNSFDLVIRKRLIIKFIIKTLGNAKDIEKVHVDDIIKLCENNVGGKYLMPNKNIKILINKGKVEYTKIEGGANEKVI